MGAAGRVPTQRDLNGALLARQLLLEPGGGSIPAALERMAGLQSQYAPAMYIGLRSRMDGLRRDAVTRVDEFEPLDPADRRAVAEAAEALAVFHRLRAV